MYNAPSVSYPVGRCAFQRKLYWLLTCATSVLLLAWAFLQSMSVPWFLAVFACAFAILLGGRACLHDEARLTWDGEYWCLHDQAGRYEAVFGTVSVSVDAQHTLVLQWQPLSDGDKQSKRWLWLGAENAPIFWQDLRCAVFARSSTL